ncbi:DNA-binding LacI/PurR family transcriptional regulator [Actinoplanes lutulentus]|uniref:DNA-binding LacI/PurR family transcriptional regulator n=1 Tax=Actinoplanes lutulentus TaxID=1287878 RepID=A0A327Z4C4_9ACTN|nr:LacI family DNA-binding transcriptional regulator [Actinoplanes lutulentus]MBB2946926.1 DNA-binding LacI/PurR family transcriptional regulator [Actinoplanes lutulentus]RAK30429.1 DNA-binding LacI/PurR family transcriptional regulator [Actinoplanes lutulentus]
MDGKRATLADVARVAGVSRATASRAINGMYGTSETMRDHVRAVAARLGFEPHTVARALATGKASAARRERIEVLIVDPDPAAMSAKPFYGRVLTGAMRALGDQDISLEVRRVAEAPAAPGTRDDDPPFGRLLINVSGPAGAAYARRSRTVALGRSAPGVTFVAPDNDSGGYQAAMHLVSTGRQRIGAVFGPPTPCALERRAGFLRVMAGAAQTVVAADGDFTRARAYAATVELLAREPRLDAVFAACDVTAMGVLQALREAGRRVPHDVAVVGFDGSTLAEAADLSSVYMPVEDEAASAIHHLLDPALPAPGRLPTTLTVRGSS